MPGELKARTKAISTSKNGPGGQEHGSVKATNEAVAAEELMVAVTIRLEQMVPGVAPGSPRSPESSINAVLWLQPLHS